MCILSELDSCPFGSFGGGALGPGRWRQLGGAWDKGGGTPSEDSFAPQQQEAAPDAAVLANFICPQCGAPVDKLAKDLICGHFKCQSCLAKDVTNCSQCGRARAEGQRPRLNLPPRRASIAGPSRRSGPMTRRKRKVIKKVARGRKTLTKRGPFKKDGGGKSKRF